MFSPKATGEKVAPGGENSVVSLGAPDPLMCSGVMTGTLGCACFLMLPNLEKPLWGLGETCRGCVNALDVRTSCFALPPWSGGVSAELLGVIAKGASASGIAG